MKWPGSIESIAARKSGQVITVTRSAAIIRQLDTAIWLWLLDGDPISAHLLIMAAYQCLLDIGKDAKGPEAYKTIGYDKFFSFYEYLKHASADPNDLHDFPPTVNELALWDCIGSFERIFGASSVYMDAFVAYFALHLGTPKIRENASIFLPEGTDLKDAASLSKVDFFTKFTPMLNAGKRPV